VPCQVPVISCAKAVADNTANASIFRISFMYELLLGNYDKRPFEVQDTAFAGLPCAVAAISMARDGRVEGDSSSTGW
jgi:hypothetical protein